MSHIGSDESGKGLSRRALKEGGVPLFWAITELGAHVRAQALRARREAVGLTQDEAAHLAGISSSTWSNLENPHYPAFRPRTLRKAFRALQVPEDAEVREADTDEVIEVVTHQPFAARSSARESGWTQQRSRRAEQIAQDLHELDEDDLEVVAHLVDRLRGRN
jgi:transcriptional regulator with XRE-family HTH domain